MEHDQVIGVANYLGFPAYGTWLSGLLVRALTREVTSQVGFQSMQGDIGQ
jgi:hypothetical protein